jgi:hypothetical protein
MKRCRKKAPWHKIVAYDSGDVIIGVWLLRPDGTLVDRPVQHRRRFPRAPKVAAVIPPPLVQAVNNAPTLTHQAVSGESRDPQVLVDMGQGDVGESGVFRFAGDAFDDFDGPCMTFPMETDSFDDKFDLFWSTDHERNGAD